MYEKIKEFFKKNWLYFASFISGIIASLFYVFRRNSSYNEDVQQLRNNISELRKQLERGQNIVNELETTNNELREELQREIDGARESIDQLGNNSNESTEYLEQFRKTNRQLEQFIEKYGYKGKDL